MMTESLQSRIEKWEMKAKDQLEQVVDDEIFRFQYPELKSQVADKLERIKEDVGNLKSFISTQTLSPDDGDGVAQEWADVGVEEDAILESEGMPGLSAILQSPPESSPLQKCLLCLTVFPEKMAIKKRPLIYWWIGEGLVTAEEHGERVFDELLEKGYIRPTTTTSFTVYPWVRRKLTQVTLTVNGNRRALLKLGDSLSEDQPVTVLNVNEQYLGTKLENWLSKWRNLEVVQMGRWQDSATHHIEAEKDFDKLLDSLASQKHLKYLSLRGISRIETLPASIRKLTTLQILDLRACHNLEKLPQGISELKKLTHLDVSECYLLDSMPKGLQRLSYLQVLKGFVVSNSKSNSCKISDLAHLTQLRKLSIRVGNQRKEQLTSLANFGALRILTISWRVVSSHQPLLSLPKGLIKLDLRSVPFNQIPGWLQPTQLPPKLEKLYIKGGNPELNNLNLNLNNYPNVKFLRINYLNGLQSHLQD